MGVVISLMNRVIRWFTGTPYEYNPTNDHIKKYHEMQLEAARGTPDSGAAPFPMSEDRDIPTSGATPFPTSVNVDDTTISPGLLTSSSPAALVYSSPPQSSSLITWSLPSQLQKYVHQAKFDPEKGLIQPEVWPTKEEFQLAINRIEYDPEKLHFAVCGGSGAGKSSLINAFRGLKNTSALAAPTGVNETTLDITRYPDSRKELPYRRLVWYDFPGAGTLKNPGWQYFNQQGLFIFDIILLVYATVITPINSSNTD